MASIRELSVCVFLGEGIIGRFGEAFPIGLSRGFANGRLAKLRNVLLYESASEEREFNGIEANVITLIYPRSNLARERKGVGSRLVRWPFQHISGSIGVRPPTKSK